MERNSKHRLHVAVLDEELPFPLDSGKRIRTYNLLSRLAARQRITYLCHRHPDPAQARQAERAMRELGIRPIVVDRAVPAKSGLGFYARLARNLFSSLPFSVATHQSADLRAAAERLCREDPPDLWHCEWTPYAEYLRRPLGQAPWVVMAHNVESLIWQRYVETETHPLKRWYIKRQFRKFEHFERWAYSSCETAIAVSADDARLIRGRFGAQRTAVVDNGVNASFFDIPTSIERNPYRILFLGSLDWRPNLDAARLLLENIFPAIRAREPRAVLQLVGRKPAPWLCRQVQGMAGVELHADVPDVRPYLAQAGMLAVPLRVGGGSRLKILEALAAGLPVISTRVGAEGLHLEPQEHFTLADSPDQMVTSVLEMMKNPQNGLEQAERGQRRVRERYEWGGLADQLETLWLKSANVTFPPQIQPVTCLV